MDSTISVFSGEANNVSFVHPDYIAHSTQVQVTRDVYDGVDNVKKYLYKLERESTRSVENRQTNLTLKNFVKRATEAFTGMIFRKHVDIIGFNDRLNMISTKIDKKKSINMFARELANDLIVDGSVFVAIDSDTNGQEDPYLVSYKRNQVINWRKDVNNMYTLLVIKEYVSVESGEFGTDVVEQYRVFKDDGNVDVYRTQAQGGTPYLHTTIQTEFEYIPVVAIELNDIPVLYDIAKLTLKHTNRTSIKDKYLDMCATPIPVVWSPDSYNDNDPTKPIYVIGADEGFVFNGSKEECDFEWRELTGSSIDKLQEDLSVIEEDIVTGIIRASNSENAVEKTATQMYYESSESANRVVVIANELEYGLNKAFKMLADIANEDTTPDARILINKDFNAIMGGSDGVRLLWEVYLGGAISIETFLDSMSKNELIDIGSVKDEIKRIEKDKFLPKAKTAPAETISSMDKRTLSATNSNTENKD